VKKQYGRVSFLAACGVVSLGLALVISFKAGPAYMHYWYVKSAVEELQLSPPRASASNADVYRQIKRHLQDNAIYDLNPEELVTITGRGDRRQYMVDYDVRVPMFFNADIMLSFRPEGVAEDS